MTYRVRNIVIAIVLAVAAGFLAVFYIAGSRDKAAEGQELVTAYVASKDIAPGTTGADLTRLFEEHEVGRDALVPGAISAPGEVSELVLAEPIYKGEQVTTTRFTTVTEQGVVGKLTGTMRALQVQGSEHQLLAGTLRDGDHIDLVATLTYSVSDLSTSVSGLSTDASDLSTEAAFFDTRERTASRVVLRDLTVLQAPRVRSDDSALRSAADDEFSTVLAVTDEQAETLFYVVTHGEWTLQLRPVDDPQDSAPSVQTIESVLGADLAPVDLARLLGGTGVIR